MATADVEPVTVDSRSSWFAQFTPDRFPLWVVEERGKIAGWLSFRMFYGRPAYVATAEVSVYIAPEFQGQGHWQATAEPRRAARPGAGT